MPVPDARLELEIDGAWVDVTGDVRAAGTQITHVRGRTENGARVDPSAATFTLASPGGKYSNRNPRSPYFGKLPRNTPVRCTVAGPTYLDLNGAVEDYAYTEDSPALDITGDIDVRFDADLTGWTTTTFNLNTVEYMGKFGINAGERSWLLGSRDSLLYFEWSADGTNTLGAKSTETLTEAAGRRAVRAALDVDNGSGGWTVTFYTADTIAGPWTQFGDPVTGTGVTSIFNSATRVRVGNASPFQFAPATGHCYAVEVRNGINGTPAANPDFTAQAIGAASFVDSAGRTWAMNGTASVSDRHDRFNLSVSEWPPSWHVSGNNVTADLTASGTLRRLGQGQKALDSTLRRRIPSYGPLAYWPMEDQGDATAAASPMSGVAPMAITNVTWEANSSLAASKPLPQIDTSSGRSVMRGTVPAPASTLTEWSVNMLYRNDTPNTSLLTYLRLLSTGTVRDWQVNTRDNLSRILGIDASGATVISLDVATDSMIFNDWVRLELQVRQIGTDVEWRVSWGVVGGTQYGVSDTFAGTLGRPTAVVSPVGGFGTALHGMAIGHISVWDKYFAFAYDNALTAWTGETAGERIARLSDEEALPITVTGTTDLQQAMGPQPAVPLLDLLGECEATDGGILYEDRASTGLRYRDRASLYNQTPKLTIPYGKLAPPLTPVDDDQQLRNDVTRQRVGGSSARVVVTDGPLSVDNVGLYDESQALSMHDDAQPVQIAGWAAHLGTWDEARYPTVRILLHAHPEIVADVLALDVGDRIQITDLPDFLPPGPADLIVQGYREDIGPRSWEVTLFCQPAGPWRVLELDSEEYSRLDTDGSELAAAVDADDTALTVTTTAGPVWVDSVTYPADFPFDVIAGGERMTVTACTGLVQDAFGRTVASGWGAADSGQTWANTGGAAADFAVSSGTGRHICATVNAFRTSLVTSPVADVDMYADVTASAVPTGDSAYALLMARYTDSTHVYMARFHIAAGGVIGFTIRKRNGAETQLASYTTGLTFTPGTWYTVRFSVQGSTLSAKVWPRSGTEPAAWQMTVTDTDLTAAGSVGVRTLLGTALTNPLPITFEFDNVRSTPQTMTVARSVNGISKAHAAGAALSLADPVVIPL